MFERRKIQGTDDFFLELKNRPTKGVYFYRINGYNTQIGEFIQKYSEAARQSGVIIEGKIANPTEQNLAYYQEIMGLGFQMSEEFIFNELKKWLPRMNDYQRREVASSVFYTLDAMRKSGKNDNILKNTYIKFMCWLYYKFERIVGRLGSENVPKILYEGDISNYELMLISILSGAGCDVVLLQYRGDAAYLKLDPSSRLSDKLELTGMGDFPADFSLKNLRLQAQAKADTERLYGVKPDIENCTNAWIKGKGPEDILTAVQSRGNDSRFFYNCFIRINGVEDKLAYQNRLYSFYRELKNSGRRVVVAENEIPKPAVDEINSIARKSYARQDMMLMDLAANIRFTASDQLQRVMRKAFIDVLLEQSKAEDMNLNRLTNKAVYMLCWLKRYQSGLFSDWKNHDIGCFIYLGGCKNSNEALFLKLLSKLPVDVLILVPNLNTKCLLEDRYLYEINYRESLSFDKFPSDGAQVRMGTAAYNAERELDSIMYQDSGLYRNQQYGSADALTLKTTYEEIAILWDQELKYRPNFAVQNHVVTLPVIFAKVSGVKDGNTADYWQAVKKLITEDTYTAENAPLVNNNESNPMKSCAAEFFKNGRLQREKIKAHKNYQYGFLREDIQNHILDKLQLLIDLRLIKGTFENGMEYTIIAEVLNMKKEIVRMIQKFDFTKKNPKIVYINTTESIISTEDAILTAFLNLAGFDIVFFIPTGYQNVENHFTKKLMEEYQIGEYMYDLHIPDLGRLPSNTRRSWREKIFKRGM